MGEYGFAQGALVPFETIGKDLTVRQQHVAIFRDNETICRNRGWVVHLLKPGFLPDDQSRLPRSRAFQVCFAPR